MSQGKLIVDVDGSLGIPESKLHLLNKSLDENWLHTPPELGGGVTALFDGFHQVHCLVSCIVLLNFDFAK